MKYTTFNLILFCCLMAASTFAQVAIPFSCAMPADLPNSAAVQLNSAQSCDPNNSFAAFHTNHDDDMVPQGIDRKLKIRTNIIFVHNLDGEGSFSTSNPAHMDFFNKVFTQLNARLEQLVDQSCTNCTTAPTHYDNVHIEFVPTYIEIVDDYYWDHTNDPDPNAGTVWVNSFDKPYLNYINNLAKQTPGYVDGFNVIITVDGPFFNTYVHNNPNNQPLWTFGYNDLGVAFYAGYWYSAKPTFNLNHPAMWHAPDMYLWYINGIDHVYPYGDEWLETDYIPSCAKTFLHEYGHYFNLSHDGCVHNVMNVGGDRTSFTGCQMREAYLTLMTKNLRKYVACEDVLDFDLTVNTNETWKLNKRIYGDVVVKNGATLTISCQVHMSPNAKFVVEQGGTLIIDGASMTGDCSDKWKGIVVEGDVPGQQLMSGKVILKNDAIVEYAKDAVSMYPYYLPWDNGGLHNYFGGIVQAEQCTIRLCNRGVEFMRYGQGGIRDKSTFKNVLFEDLREGVTDWADDGVTFEKCTFRRIAKRGIHPYDSEVIVKDGCTFNEQPYGVDAISTYPITFSPKIGKIGTTPNQFTCTKAGVNIQSGSNVEPFKISNNKFTTGNCGVCQNGNGLIDINHNEFKQHLKSSIEIFGGGTQYNIVNENDVISSFKGAHAIKQNTGLRFLDNCFATNSLVDIFVSSGDIHPDQGNDDVAAGNCFTKSGIPELDNDAGSGIVNYHIKIGTPTSSCKRPVNSPSINLLIDADDDNMGADCGPQFFGGGGGENFCGASDNMSITDLKAVRNTILQSISNLGSSPNPSQQLLLTNYKSCLERLENLIGQKMLDPFSTDPNSGRENAITFFSAPEMDFMGKISAYGIMVHNGQITRARTYLNSLTAQNQEQTNFVGVQNINLDYLEQPFSYVLQQETKGYLHSVGTSDGSLNGYARSLYEVLTGERIEVVIPEVVIERARIYEESNLKNKEINISPNPVWNAQFSIRAKNLDPSEVYRISLTNISGVPNAVWEHGGSDKMDFDLSGTATGIYFLKVVDSKGAILHQAKLVVFN